MTVHRALLLGLTSVAVTASLPSPADAGTFDVVACDQSVAAGANNSFTPYADPGMSAYADCRPFGEGLVARNVVDNETTPSGNRAAMIFDAPAGTSLERITFDGAIERHTCTYSAILAGGGRDFGGQTLWGYGPNTQCGYPYAENRTAFNFPGQSVALAGERVRLETQCVAAGCSRNGRAGVRARNVRVTVRDDSAPVISAARGSLWTRAGWLGGEQSVGLTGVDNTGIRELRVLADGQQLTAQTFACDVTQRVPCPTIATLDRSFAAASLGKDGRHLIKLMATDAAGNVSSADREVAVDNTPPDAPKDLALEGGDIWRSVNLFAVSWKNPGQGYAPIAAAEYELCRPTGQDCVTGTRERPGIERIDDLKVPAPGDWQLKLWLRDAAGNQDRRLIAPPVRLRFDDTSPEPSIQRLSPDNPAHLVVTTRDTGSGLAGGAVELRRAGSQRWRPQAVTVDGSGLVAAVDDERLMDGTYEVRATVIDQAGNQRSSQLWADGQSATIAMPIRLKTSMRAGIRRGRGSRVRLARAAVVRYGQRVRVRGRLTTPEGNPLQDVDVEILSDIMDATAAPKLLATVRTSRTGTFSVLVRRGPSRTVTIRYRGAPRIRPTTRVLQLDVRSRTTIRPNRRRLVNGDTVRLRGRIATGRIPAAGKLVEVQVLLRGRWRTFATTRSGRRGTWYYDYRFDGTRGNQTYRFRARIPRESGYPFATGGSRATSVRVRGL